MRKKISKRTVALFAAALVLLGSSGVMGTRAVPGIRSDIFDRGIETDSLAVQILDNKGSEVGVKYDPEEGLSESKLYTELDETITPGEKYDSKVSVKNTGSADEYVRVVVRKYWTDDNGKNTTVKPEMIELTAATPDDGYSWTAVKESDETTVYYLNKPISGDSTVDLFSAIRINEKVVTEGRKISEESTADGVTTINYRYEFDGLQFNVEAEAQSVQTHSAEEAIKSVWGVDASDVGIDL